MIVSPALILLTGLLSGASALEPVPTYEHQDRVTGETLTCAKCPPGTHMAAHCTASTPTECAPCGDDHFTALWNYLPRCLYCNNFCFGSQEVALECTATSNRVCRCKGGHYRADGFCFRHSECGPGHGVTTNGTAHADTVCERCAAGFFSGSSSALEPCASHRECAAGRTLLSGSAYHDAVCGTCEDMANAGEPYATFLSGFLHAHRMRVAKLKRLVTRYVRKSGEERATVVPRERGPLLDEITAWLTEAPKEQLKKLPEMLRAARLSHVAKKLEEKLKEIQQRSPNCTLQFNPEAHSRL